MDVNYKSGDEYARLFIQIGAGADADAKQAELLKETNTAEYRYLSYLCIFND